MSTRAAAERQAKMIEDFWAKQGFEVHARAMPEAEAIPSREGSPVGWTVRIEPPLVNGIPRGATRKTATTILRAFDRTHTDWRTFLENLL